MPGDLIRASIIDIGSVDEMKPDDNLGGDLPKSTASSSRCGISLFGPCAKMPYVDYAYRNRNLKGEVMAPSPTKSPGR